MGERDEARERVETELDELNEKIVKLSAFLFGKNIAKSGISYRMKDCLNEQLRIISVILPSNTLFLQIYVV